jgi:hypothetical protein
MWCNIKHVINMWIDLRSSIPPYEKLVMSWINANAKLVFYLGWFVVHEDEYWTWPQIDANFCEVSIGHQCQYMWVIFMVFKVVWWRHMCTHDVEFNSNRQNTCGVQSVCVCELHSQEVLSLSLSLSGCYWKIIMQILYWPSLGIFIAQGPW